MKNYILALAVFLLIISNAYSKPLFVAASEPAAMIIKELAQNKAEIMTLTPPGSSPHTYSPKPSQMIKAQKAKAVEDCRSTQTLTNLQAADGSWTDAWGFDKPGSTGLALQALVAAGVPTDAPSPATEQNERQRICSRAFFTAYMCSRSSRFFGKNGE